MPSASPHEVLERTLLALAESTRRVPGVVALVAVADDRPERAGVDGLVRRAGAVRVVTDHAGAAVARNRGAAAGSSDWLLFLDDDVELDPGALSIFAGPELDADVLVGSLRAPDGPDVPSWLRRSYVTGTMAPSAESVRGANSDGTFVSSALLVVRRALFERVGGFPELGSWGWEDPLFGMRAQRNSPREQWLAYDNRLAGIHHYVPSWDAWLARQQTAGRTLRDVLRLIDEDQQSQLLRAVGLRDGPKSGVKKTLGRAPMGVWTRARGAALRRVATSAAFAHGFREASRAE